MAVFCRGTAVFCRGSGYRKKPTKLCPKLREYKSEVETGEKRWKKGVHIKRENKPSLPINRVCQNSLWKVRENLYPWNCCPVGFLEMLGKVGLVSERYHPTHPTHPSHPTHSAHGYKMLQVSGVFGLYVCKCKARYHPTPPTPPTPCMDTSDVFGQYVRKCKVRYHPTPPTHPTHPVHGYKWS